MRNLPKTKILFLSLVTILGINLWSCWSSFRWPFLSVQAMWFVIISEPHFRLNWEFLDFFEKTGGGWRPLAGLTWALLYKILGAEPLGYHILEYSNYLLWSFGAFLLTRLLTQSAAMALGTSLLLAFIPARLAGGMVIMHTFITWTLILGTFFLYLTLKGAYQGSWRLILTGLLLFAASPLFREDAVIFWALFVCMALYLTRVDPPSEKCRKMLWRAILLSGIIALGYAWVRMSLFGDRQHYPDYISYSPPLGDVLQRYAYAPLWLSQAFWGIPAILRELQTPSGLGKLLSAGLLLTASALLAFNTLPEHDGTSGRKKYRSFVLLALGVYLLGLWSTCYFRVPPHPAFHPGRLDIWGRTEDLYRPTLSYLGLIWMVLGLLSPIGPRIFRISCTTLVLLFLALDCTYFRHFTSSPYKDSSVEIQYATSFREAIQSLPAGTRILIWDTVPGSQYSTYPMRNLFINQAKLLGRSKNWSVEYLGKLTPSRDSTPPWKKPDLSHAADAWIWHESDPQSENAFMLYESPGSIKAYSSRTAQFSELVKFGRSL